MRVEDAVISTMTLMAEARHHDTGCHLRRTQQYVHELAVHLADHPRFSAFLDGDVIDVIRKSAPLHDIGKVGVPDHILLKPGRLTAEEFDEMKRHTLYGHSAIVAIEKDTPGCVLSIARDIAYCHHEKWDGTGYPEGLKGDEIPIPARLMALADVYDALISSRPYKRCMRHEEAREIILRTGGAHFDPDVVDAFARLQGRFARIAGQYTDAE